MVTIGTRALSESGAVGNFAREQIELYCVSELVNCFLDTDEEFLYLDCSCSSGLVSYFIVFSTCAVLCHTVSSGHARIGLSAGLDFWLWTGLATLFLA